MVAIFLAEKEITGQRDHLVGIVMQDGEGSTAEERRTNPSLVTRAPRWPVHPVSGPDDRGSGAVELFSFGITRPVPKH